MATEQSTVQQAEQMKQQIAANTDETARHDTNNMQLTPLALLPLPTTLLNVIE